jgi:hypothetical protein
MKTINANYQKNIDILKENLKRGMTSQQANSVIDNMEKQFTSANLYNSEEKLFIEYMRTATFLHFTGIQIVNNR